MCGSITMHALLPRSAEVAGDGCIAPPRVAAWPAACTGALGCPRVRTQARGGHRARCPPARARRRRGRPLRSPHRTRCRRGAGRAASLHPSGRRWMCGSSSRASASRPREPASHRRANAASVLAYANPGTRSSAQAANSSSSSSLDHICLRHRHTSAPPAGRPRPAAPSPPPLIRRASTDS